MNRRNISKLIIILTLITGVVAICTGCGNPDKVYEVGNCTFQLPEGWSNVWLKDEYASSDNDRFLKAGADDETSYKEATTDFWNNTSKAAAAGNGYSDLAQTDVTVDGHKGQLYTYMLQDDDLYFCAMLIIEDGNGLANFSYGARNETADNTEFTQIMDTIKFSK